jgi:hypothetical protein
MKNTVLTDILRVIKGKTLTPGTAYVVFSCGCTIVQDEFNAIKRVFKTRKGKSRAVCPNHPSFENKYLGRYRICARCGMQEAARKGRGFETNVCKACNTSEWDIFKVESKKNKNIDKDELRERIRNDIPIKRKKRTKYYQNGKLIKEPENPETDPLCKHRDDCLDVAGYRVDTFIHCRGCPNKEYWIDI